MNYSMTAPKWNMRIQIQRAAEALDKGHRSAADGGVALRSSLLAIPSLDGTEKYR